MQDPNDATVYEEFKKYQKRLWQRRKKQYELSDAWGLLEVFLKERGIVANQLDSFNWFYEEVGNIPDQVILKYDPVIIDGLEVDRNVYQIIIKNFTFSLPFLQDVSSKIDLSSLKKGETLAKKLIKKPDLECLTPRKAAITKNHYLNNVMVDVTFKIYSEKTGKVLIMRKSIKCLFFLFLACFVQECVLQKPPIG